MLEDHKTLYYGLSCSYYSYYVLVLNVTTTQNTQQIFIMRILNFSLQKQTRQYKFLKWRKNFSWIHFFLNIIIALSVITDTRYLNPGLLLIYCVLFIMKSQKCWCPVFQNVYSNWWKTVLQPQKLWEVTY